MRVKENCEKTGLKFNIQKTKLMASIPVTSWLIVGKNYFMGKKWKLLDFIFLDSKITAGIVCSHGIKRHLLLGKKVVTHLDSVLKNRDISLLTKVHLVKAAVFPVVVYGCES